MRLSEVLHHHCSEEAMRAFLDEAEDIRKRVFNHLLSVKEASIH